MGIREQISELIPSVAYLVVQFKDEELGGKAFSLSQNILHNAAVIAEARERELLNELDSQANAHNQYTLELSLQISAYEKERAQMIAELRELTRYQDNCSSDESFMQADRHGEYIEFCEIKAIINKYEVKQ